jgi:hypothetical protein
VRGLISHELYFLATFDFFWTKVHTTAHHSFSNTTKQTIVFGLPSSRDLNSYLYLGLPGADARIQARSPIERYQQQVRVGKVSSHSINLDSSRSICPWPSDFDLNFNSSATILPCFCITAFWNPTDFYLLLLRSSRCYKNAPPSPLPLPCGQIYSSVGNLNCAHDLSPNEIQTSTHFNSL